MKINDLTLEDMANAMQLRFSDAQKQFFAECERIHNEGKRVVIVSDRRNRCFIIKGELIAKPPDAERKG